MLNEQEKKMLELMKSRLLITKGELASAMGGSDGVEVSVQKLRDMGYIEKVESVGVCYVITQQGLRALKEE